MNTFLRALYLLVVEAVLLPLQLIALVVLYIYYIVDNLNDGYDFVESIRIANYLWLGAWYGVKILGNFVKTGELTF